MRTDHAGRAGVRVAATLLLAALVGPMGALPAQAQDRLEVLARLRDASRLWHEGRPDAAVALWRALARTGDAAAQYQLAQAHYLGRGTDRDPARALVLARQSAEQGYPPGQLLAGAILMEAGGEQAVDLAQRYWQAAAQAGNVLAPYRLGLLHWEARAVPKDPVRAYAWMHVSATGGLDLAEQAQQRMGTAMSEADRSAGESLAQRLRQGELPAPAPALAAPAEPDPADPDPADPESADPEPADQGADPPAQDTPLPQSGWQVQLASLPQQAEAQAMADALESRDKDLLGGRQVRVVAVDLGDRGTYYRVRVGYYADRAAAARACSGFQAAGRQCILIQPEP